MGYREAFGNIDKMKLAINEYIGLLWSIIRGQI